MVRLVRRFLPQILVALAVTSIMLVAYASAGFAYATSAKASWSSDPLNISFAASAGSGSASNSVSCSQDLSDLTVRVLVSNPTRMRLTATPTSLSCGNTPLTVTFTATCLGSAAVCRGSYHGLVQLRQPSNYRDIPANLNVVIVVG